MLGTDSEKQTLIKFCNSLPTFIGTLVSKNRQQEIIDSQQMELPISDHPLAIVNTKLGVIGTMNLWAPGTPISPGQSPLAENLYRLEADSDKYLQLEKLAEYIAEAFHLGLDALMLQEVAKLDSKYFDFFVEKLSAFVNPNKISLDISGFKESYRLTRRDPTSYHDFGCSLLVNSGTFKFCKDEIIPVLEERGFIYHITHVSGERVTLINIHGDYKKAEELGVFIKMHANDAIIGGDLNIHIASSNEKALALLQSTNGACILPEIKNHLILEQKKTLDGLFLSSSLEPEFLFQAWGGITMGQDTAFPHLSLFGAKYKPIEKSDETPFKFSLI